MDALIIYNKNSGKGNLFNKKDYIIKRLKEKYNKVCFYESQRDIKDYIIMHASNYHLLIIIGGDGSINEAINGLILLKNKPLLAYIPAGTCNDFGSSLGLNKRLENILDIILEENVISLNVNKINTEYFIYGLAVGNFTDVSYKTKQGEKRIFGRLAYYFNAIKSLFKDHSINGNFIIENSIFKIDCFCFLVLNTRFLASFKMRFRDNILNSNKLKLVIIKKNNRLVNIMDLVLFFLFGDHYHHDIEYYDASNINVNFTENINFNLDGELVSLINNVIISREESGIKLIIDNDMKCKYFNK